MVETTNTQSNILPPAISVYFQHTFCFIHWDLKVDVSGICDMGLCWMLSSQPEDKGGLSCVNMGPSDGHQPVCCICDTVLTVWPFRFSTMHSLNHTSYFPQASQFGIKTGLLG